MRIVRVRPSPLTHDAWAPFGWLPVEDDDPRDAAHRLHFEWADPNLNVIAHAYYEVERGAQTAQCTVLYRHDTHTQALLVLNVHAVIAVAPAVTRFEDVADVEAIRAFSLQPLDCFVLHRGTWHWGPFPTRPGPAVRLLNVQGARYREDNASVDLTERLGAAVEVETERPIAGGPPDR